MLAQSKKTISTAVVLLVSACASTTPETIATPISPTAILASVSNEEAMNSTALAIGDALQAAAVQPTTITTSGSVNAVTRVGDEASKNHFSTYPGRMILTRQHSRGS
jgi:hypothetical protein